MVGLDIKLAITMPTRHIDAKSLKSKDKFHLRNLRAPKL